MLLQRLLRRRSARSASPDAQLIADSARHVAIITVDRNGIITSWNAGAQTLLGYAPGDAVGRTQTMLFTAEDLASGVPAAESQRARAQGRAEIEHWLMRRDGSRFWASGELMPLAGGGYLRMVHDRTEARQAMRRLEQMLSELQQAQRVARVGSWIWNAETDVVTASDELYRI